MTALLDVIPIWEWWIFRKFISVSEKEDYVMAAWYAILLKNWFNSKSMRSETELIFEYKNIRIAKSTDGKNTLWLTYQYY